MQKLLISILNQYLSDNIYLEIIVVDNDINHSAKDVVSQIKNTERIHITYFTQPVKSISLTRNLALNNSSGKFIAIIDDDEIADKLWIYNLVNAITSYNADAVFGFVEPIYSYAAPEWSKQRELYFNPKQKTGSIAKATFTTNCLFKSSIMRKYKLQFNPEFGLSGGEDTFFFETLRSKGAKLINCGEAISFEEIPIERSSMGYLLLKSFQGGNTYARNQILLHQSRSFLTRIEMICRGSIGIVVYILQALISIYHRKKLILILTKISANFGKFFAGLNYIYKHYK